METIFHKKGVFDEDAMFKAIPDLTDVLSFDKYLSDNGRLRCLQKLIARVGVYDFSDSDSLRVRSLRTDIKKFFQQVDQQANANVWHTLILDYLSTDVYQNKKSFLFAVLVYPDWIVKNFHRSKMNEMTLRKSELSLCLEKLVPLDASIYDEFFDAILKNPKLVDMDVLLILLNNGIQKMPGLSSKDQIKSIKKILGCVKRANLNVVDVNAITLKILPYCVSNNMNIGDSVCLSMLDIDDIPEVYRSWCVNKNFFTSKQEVSDVRWFNYVPTDVNIFDFFDRNVPMLRDVRELYIAYKLPQLPLSYFMTYLSTVVYSNSGGDAIIKMLNNNLKLFKQLDMSDEELEELFQFDGKVSKELVQEVLYAVSVAKNPMVFDVLEDNLWGVDGNRLYLDTKDGSAVQIIHHKYIIDIPRVHKFWTNFLLNQAQEFKVEEIELFI